MPSPASPKDKRMVGDVSTPEEGILASRALQVAIRVGLVLLLIAWCFTIIRPFLVPVVWGIVIAVATYNLFAALQRLLGGRAGLAAFAYATIALLVLILPALLLTGTHVDAVRELANGLLGGTLRLPPPPPAIETWPLIGEPLTSFWQLASSNLEAAIREIGPELAVAGRWLLGLVGATALGLIQFVLAIVIAAALLSNAASGGQLAGDIATRLAGARGPTYATLAVQTIRTVARGIIGVALIQSTLAGLGFLAVGQPMAGFLAMLCLVLAILQVGPLPVILPVVVYQFTVLDTTTAALFTAWCVLVSLIDNVLKPILLGRGVDLPMLVIFIGAIGGVMSSGLLGLFIGPVVLALGYTLFMAWLKDARATA
jgi:predicted PurR-regulated permease PerM